MIPTSSRILLPQADDILVPVPYFSCLGLQLQTRQILC